VEMAANAEYQVIVPPSCVAAVRERLSWERGLKGQTKGDIPAMGDQAKTNGNLTPEQLIVLQRVLEKCRE